MLDYVTIDFETANSYRGSPCSVGLVRVRNGSPVAERHWLIKPPEGVDYFDPFNTMIHGITEEMVADAPRWRNALPAIMDFIGDDVVVAHNAGFDTGVIRYACAVDNIEWPELRFLCTMVLARRALSLPSYRLPFVVDALGCPLNNHHNALADARAVVDVISGLATRNSADDLDALAHAIGVRIGQMSGGIYTGSVALSPGGSAALSRAELNPDADPDGYLYGRVVVFTGTLFSMTRQIAWDECSRVGAIAERDTTRRTNVLVIGDVNEAVLRPGSTVTGKARRAFELQAQGQAIEVMTEDDFLRCLDGKPLPAMNSGGHQAEPAVPQKPLPTRVRKVPLAERPQPTTSKPRALRRERVPTDQKCCVEGCTSTAAFKTRSKPTWCDEHIIELQWLGGLKPLEPFTHPDDWQLTECLTCTVQAHYRFTYTLDKNRYGEPTCRACYWRALAGEPVGDLAYRYAVSYEEAKARAEEYGFDYLGPLSVPSLPGSPHHARCRRCGRISAQRLGDMSFGCTCPG